MAIADKLLELNDVKQDIKTAIEDKGVDMTDVPFTGYSTKIDSITGMSYHDYANNLYTMWGYETQFTEAWTESQNSLEVLFEIPLMLAAANQDMAVMEVDIYVGTNSALTAFYNLVAGGGIPAGRAIIVNKSVIHYMGDISSDIGFPLPVYAFGMPGGNPATLDVFFLADLTPAGMGLGIALAKSAGVVIPDNSITIRRGFENYEAGLIIPEMIEIVGEMAFEKFGYSDSANAPLVPYIIGLNVKYIGDRGFASLKYQPPVTIPDSVEWIGASAFSDYKTNANFIVVPRNVTYIGENAFGYGGADVVIMYPDTPPVHDGSAFPTDTVSIYVPDNSVNAYKSAWSEYASKIEALSSLPSGNIDGIAIAVELTQAQYDALSVYDSNTYYLIVEE